MMDISLSTLLNALIIGVVGLAVLAISVLLVKGKQEAPELLQKILPDQLELFIAQAAKYAALFVERVDTEGHLDQFFDEIKDKSQQKLELAIDVASERLESYIELFFLQRGITVDIDVPEEFIKDVIQRYVWENPDLFPAKAKQEIPTVAEPQAAPVENPYVGYRRPQRQAGNYPATAPIYSGIEVVKAEERKPNDADSPAQD